MLYLYKYRYVIVDHPTAYSIRCVRFGTTVSLSMYRYDVNGRLVDALCLPFADDVLCSRVWYIMYVYDFRNALEKMSLTPHPSCGKNIYVGSNGKKGHDSGCAHPCKSPRRERTLSGDRGLDPSSRERNRRLAMSRRVPKMRCVCAIRFRESSVLH